MYSDFDDNQLIFKFSCNNCFSDCPTCEVLDFCNNYVPLSTYKEKVISFIGKDNFDNALKIAFDTWSIYHG